MRCGRNPFLDSPGITLHTRSVAIGVVYLGNITDLDTLLDTLHHESLHVALHSIGEHYASFSLDNNKVYDKIVSLLGL